MTLFRSAMRAVTIAFCAAAFSAAAIAQATNSGDIRGTVTDSTGALLPGVTVTVTNTQTGITKVLTTNKDGLYDTSSIVVGQYSVSFEKPGFSKFERSSISLEVGVSTVNANMKVGSTQETVVEATDLPLLDTESGTQQTTLEAKSMAVLPNTGQDWQNFTILLPGTSGANSSAGSISPGQEISANGNLPYSNVLADGASTTLSHSANADVDIFETVAELQVSTSAFSAQYGIGGIIFNQISKGGTNRFHGTGYDYFQSTQFNAQNPQINSSSSTAPAVYSHRYNNFGASIGGPVLLPYIKNKAFFYFNYDQVVSRGAAGLSGIKDIPTVAVMGGDFSGQPTLYDPTTQTIGRDSKGNAYPIRKSFISEYGSNAIPAAMFDKVAANFQKYYPTPTNHIATGKFLPGRLNGQGQLQANFQSAEPASNPLRRYFGRFDYDINAKNRLTMSVTQRDVPVVAPSDTTACPIGCQNQDVDSYNPQITEVWTISPHTINEVRLGYTYQGNFFGDQSLGRGTAAQLGWQFAKADTIPSIQFTNNYPYTWIGPATNAVYKEHVFDPSDVVTMIRGKHVLHFGGEMLIYQDNSTNWGNQNAGTFQFSGQYTQQWTLDANGVASPNGSTGADYADFLLGQAQNWNAGVSPEYAGRLKNPEIFIQDDYKIRPNFTLNVGVRYQIRRGWSETHGNEDTYDPTVINPATNTPGAIWYGTTKANGRTQLESNKYTSVLPRAGFSWLIHPNMTVRGGFGLYAYNLSLDTYGGGLGALLSSGGNYADTSGGVIPATILGGPGTEVANGTALPYTLSSDTRPTRFNGQSVSYTQYDAPDPKIYQWNLDIQQGIGSNTSFELAYVGSHAFHLNFPTDLNQVPNALTSQHNYDKNKPNPNYNSIGGSTNDAISNYHSLQASLNRRLSRGLSFGFNYTWSHFLDDQDSSGWGNREGPQSRQYADAPSNYSNSNFDIRNAFKGLVVYEIPVGKGRMFFNHNSFVDEIFGGYQISSTMQLRSGNPFSVFATSGDSYTGPGQAQPFANYSGGPIYTPGTRTSKQWYNTAVFSVPALGTFGNTRRNFLYGPGLELINISAGKKFDIYENVKLQIRVDANNAFNHPNLGTPNGNFDTLAAATATTAATPQVTGASTSGRYLQGGIRLEF